MFLSSTPINISGCLDILTCGVFVFTSVSKQADDDYKCFCDFKIVMGNNFKVP